MNYDSRYRKFITKSPCRIVCSWEFLKRSKTVVNAIGRIRRTSTSLIRETHTHTHHKPFDILASRDGIITHANSKRHLLYLCGVIHHPLWLVYGLLWCGMWVPLMRVFLHIVASLRFGGVACPRPVMSIGTHLYSTQPHSYQLISIYSRNFISIYGVLMVHIIFVYDYNLVYILVYVLYISTYWWSSWWLTVLHGRCIYICPVLCRSSHNVLLYLLGYFE